MASSPLVGDVKNVGNLNSIKINKFQWVKRHTNKFEMRRLFLLNSHESYKNGKWMKIPEKAKKKKLNQVGMMLLFLLHQLPTKRSWHRQQLTHEKWKKPTKWRRIEAKLLLLFSLISILLLFLLLFPLSLPSLSSILNTQEKLTLLAFD